LIVLASCFFPVMGNILYITGHSPFPGMDITPIGFALTGLLLTWGLFQYKLLDLLPLGRDTIIENLNDCVIIIDTHNRILDFNPAAITLFDLDNKPEIGDPLEKNFPEVMKLLNYLPDPDPHPGHELHFRNKILELRKTDIRVRQDISGGCSLFISNITAEKNAENAIKESEERSRSLMESAPFPMLICDIVTGAILYHNKCASESLNIISSNRSEISLPSLFCDPAEYKRLVSILYQNQLVTDYEAQVYANRNKRIWVLSTVSIIPFAKEEVMLVSFNDITSRKLMEDAEKQQRQFNEAMIDSAAALNSTLNFDEVLDRILTNLEKVISHTFANIMLVNDNGEVKIVRAHGYDAKGLENLFQNISLSVAETPSLLKMAMDGSPIVIPDTQTDPEWKKNHEKQGVRSYLGVPILVKGKVMGYINVESELPQHYNKNHGRQLLAFANQAAVAIENSRLFEQMGQMAVVDPLTGLYNRRHFYELGEIEIERARRYSSPLSLLMIDLDHFKNFNDTFGHAVGDKVLQEASKVTGSTLRKIDIPGRLGGEEFVVLLPETNEQNGLIVADRLRNAISSIRIPIEDGDSLSVTASIGLASLNATHANLQSLITSADIAMYKAKENGRNRVEIARVTE
jgi:diguanylate cyclase (GGDEF)-like protein